MIVKDVEQFSSWLIKELKPICDADPIALAKYVIALVRKPDKTDDEIMAFASEQLEVFLPGGSKRFVDKMFAVLADESYIATKKDSESTSESKSEKSPSPDLQNENVSKESSKIEDDAKASSSKETKVDREDSSKDRKRTNVSVDTSDRLKRDDLKGDRSFRKKISPPAQDAKREREVVRRRSRSPRDRRQRPRRSPEHRRHPRRSRSRSRSADRRDDRKKRRCRDFDEQGYCVRGDHCPYDHGPDPVIVDNGSAIEKMVKGPAPNFSVPPPGYNPINPPPPGVENVYSTPQVVEGYNPEAPSLNGPNYSVPPPPLPVTTSAWRPAPYVVPSANLIVPIAYDPTSTVPVDPSSAGGPIRSAPKHRGRGGMMMSSSRPLRNNGDGKTLHVKKVPYEQNNISALNEHFASFGNIVNIQVQYNGEPDSALITYSCRPEAVAAYKSPTPVLNNRFIKVFWFNPECPDGMVPLQGGMQRSVLNSGLPVERPTPLVVNDVPPLVVNEASVPLKVATIEESKFVNPVMRENFNKLSELKRELIEARGKLQKQVSLANNSNELLNKYMENQKRVMIMARSEGITEEVRKKSAKLAKENSKKIEVLKTEALERSKDMQATSDEIKRIEKIREETARQMNERLSESPPAGTVSVVKTENITDFQADVSEKRVAPLIAKNFKVFFCLFLLLIYFFPLDDESLVVEAMEKFGELVDVEMLPGPESACAFTFKNEESALEALKSGLFIGEGRIDLDWMHSETVDVKVPVGELLKSPGDESDDE